MGSIHADIDQSGCDMFLFTTFVPMPFHSYICFVYCIQSSYMLLLLWPCVLLAIDVIGGGKSVCNVYILLYKSLKSARDRKSVV